MFSVSTMVEQFPKWFKSTAVGRLAAAERAASVLEERRAHVEVKEEAVRQLETNPEVVAARKARDQAREALHRCKRQERLDRAAGKLILPGAEAKANANRENLQAIFEKAEARLKELAFPLEQARDSARNALMETAPQEITRFIQEMRDAQREVRRPNAAQSFEHQSRSHLTGKMSVDRAVSNYPARVRKLHALTLAIEAAERLKVQATEDIEAALAELRSTIPETCEMEAV